LEGLTGSATSNLRKLLLTAGLHGLRRVLAYVPGPVVTWVAVVLDETGPKPLNGVGCKASYDAAAGALGALREALQVRACLRHARDSGMYDETPERIPGESERIAYLLGTGAETVRDWVDGFIGIVGSAAGEDRTAGDTGTDHLVAALLADGAAPVVVDLTPRVPTALRAMGWAAVKVIPVGLQPLRMDEEIGWTWHHQRLATAETRTGLEARFPAGIHRRPHPLP
jgi:ribosomal protein S12 methylthiotransferase accessory factor